MKLVKIQLRFQLFLLFMLVKFSLQEDTTSKTSNQTTTKPKESTIINNLVQQLSSEVKNNPETKNNKNLNNIVNDFKFKMKGVEYETPIIRPRVEIVAPAPVVPVAAPPILPSPPVFTPFPTVPGKFDSIRYSPYMQESQMQHRANHQLAIGLHRVCACASQVRCPPCGIINPPPIVKCGCAPPPMCRKCPPLSVIHELASRKAIQDQRLASELSNISTNMTKMFKVMSKYAAEVLKYELEAKEASLKMEESSIKAQFSRQEMERTSEKARLIARNSLNPRACVNCAAVPGSPGELLSNGPGFGGFFNGNFIDDSKIFPQEVDSIGDYMKDTYSTNINGYNAGSQRDMGLDAGKIETDSEGTINVEALGDDVSSGRKQSKKSLK